MPMDSDGERPDFHEEEDGGGPVKTFLEHLEDLRWTLIKSVTAVLLGVLVCLVAGKYLVALLTWPLTRLEKLELQPGEVAVLLGTNVVGRLAWAELGLARTNSPPVRVLRLSPVGVGTNWVLALQPDARATVATSRRLVTIKNYGPIEGILVAMKLALYGGVLLASPFVFFFVGQFVLPALKVSEKRILYRAVGFGSVLFFLGVAFCYFLVAGFALLATVQFSQWLGFGADEWRADAYISFMCKFMLGMGLGFELPVVILTLVKIGLLDYEKLRAFRSYSVVGNLVIAAFATPSGDPFTMFLMALPLQLLYEISAGVAWWWERKERKQRQQTAAP